MVILATVATYFPVWGVPPTRSSRDGQVQVAQEIEKHGTQQHCNISDALVTSQHKCVTRTVFIKLEAKCSNNTMAVYK